MKQEGAEALVVLVNPIFFLQRRQIIDRAADHRLPTIYENGRGSPKAAG